MNAYVFDYFFHNRNLLDDEIAYISGYKKEDSDLIKKAGSDYCDIEFCKDDDSDCESGYSNQYATKDKKKKVYKKETYEKKAVISIFGRLEDGTSVCIHVIDYVTYFYLKIPEKYQSDTKTFVERLKYYLLSNTTMAPKHRILPTIEIEKWIDSNGFTNNEMINFARLSFKNFTTRNKFYMLFQKGVVLKKGEEEISMYEGKCYPYMRFLHDRNLPSIGYITAGKWINSEVCQTRCQVEVSCKYADLFPSENEELVAPDLSRCAFDIETAPLVSGDLNPVLSKGDPIIAMPVSFLIGEKYYNYVPILHGTLSEREGQEYEPIPCRDETELIQTFIKLLRFGPSDLTDYAPDITYSYNGNGYDWPYIYKRAEDLGIGIDLVQSSKFVNYKSRYETIELSSSGMGQNKLYYINFPGIINIDLLQYFKKQNDVELVDYKLDTVSRQYLIIADKNKPTFLDSVKILTDIISGIEGKVDEVAVKPENKYVNEIVYDAGGIDKIKDYVLEEKTERHKIEPSLPRLLNKIKLFKFTYEAYTSKKSSEDAKYSLEYTEMYAKAKRAAAFAKDGKMDEACSEMDEIATYSIQDCVLLHKLDKVRTISVNTSASANINSILWKVIFRCGSGVPIYSVVTKFAKQRNNKLIIDHFFDEYEYNKIFEDAIKNVEEVKAKYNEIVGKYGENKEMFEKKVSKFRENFYKFGVIAGGYVEEPKPGIHYNVATLDVNSEYPSIMMTHNLSIDTIVLADKYRGIEGIVYNDIEWMTVDGEKHVNTFVCDYENRKDEDQGVLPQVLEYLINRRKDVRKKQKKYKKGDPAYETLDAEQLAIKILCNSVYGTTVDKKSRLSCQPIGGCTTALARKYIIECGKMVAEAHDNATIVYGDTDSFFAEFKQSPLLSKEEGFIRTWEQAGACEKMINDFMQGPERRYKYMRIELEKVFSLLYLFDKKKKYFGKKHEKNDKGEIPSLSDFKMMTQGVKYKKRDSTLIEKFVGSTVQEFLVNERTELIFPFVWMTINEIKMGTFENRYFAKSCKYNPPYKNPAGTMGFRIWDIIRCLDEGNTPQIGQRMFYTYCNFPSNRGVPKSKIKKCDIAYPMDYLDDKKIDYPSFITFFVNNIEPILKIIDPNAYEKVRNKIKYFYAE